MSNAAQAAAPFSVPAMNPDFDHAIQDHDARLRAAGFNIWIGGEPTFTDRMSFDPAWNFAALGADKEARARKMLGHRARRHSGSVVLRTLGRQYSGEDKPRWSYGLLRRRDGQSIWAGPHDPLLMGTPPPAISAGVPAQTRDALQVALRQRGWGTLSYLGVDGSSRLAFWLDPSRVAPLPSDSRLQRASPHDKKLPEKGPVDELAADGVFALVFSRAALPQECESVLRVELPALPDVATFLSLLHDLAHCARGLPALIFTGFGPPVDDSVAFASVTPDPAVIENNMAPAPDVATFLDWNRDLYSAAQADGLEPFRLHYTGLVADSGGGGHITLGGPSPELSPFILHPHVLPQLIRYFNRHPSLSYLFAVDAVGSSSQSPRADEGVRESLDELTTSLLLLSRTPSPSADALYQSLAPFMADRTGNSHRAEINLEKFWNPWLPSRGKLGVIEFRAFRMARSPETAAALGALLRAIVAMLARRFGPNPGHDWSLVDWGAELHDRFALPFFLHKDLAEVLASLESHGFGLGRPIAQLLHDDNDRIYGTFELGGCSLTVKRAVEFWPLVGDAASQESSTARLMDSSSQRIELVIRPSSGKAADLGEWQIAAHNCKFLPARATDAKGDALVIGIRYRAFVPTIGLHPNIGAQAPVRLMLHDIASQRSWSLALHEWKAAGGAYEGLPRDELEAANRRLERVQLAQTPWTVEELPQPPTGALSAWCLDLRRC